MMRDMPIEAMPVGPPSANLFPGRGQAHADYLRGFTSYLQGRGERPRELLEPYGLDPAMLEQSGAHLSCQTVVDLLEESSRKTNDTLLGFRLAQRQEPDVLGCAVPLARAAPDFGSAIEQLIRYLPFTHSQEANLQLMVGRQSAELRWFSPVELDYCEQAYYHHIFVVYKLLAALAGSAFRATRTALRCAVREADRDAMSEALACSLQARAGANLIAFDRDWLSRPLPTANRVAFEILESSLDAIVKAMSGTLMERVRSYVSKALPTGRCTIEGCASQLGFSSRTLQKRLMEQGTSFSDLVEQTKMERAAQGLVLKARPISEIALDLGYSEHSCFTRAFKRWTGQTPEEYRQRALCEGSRHLSAR